MFLTATVAVTVSKIREGKTNKEIIAAIRAYFTDPPVISASGEKYGKAFVNFASLEAATKAVELLRGKQLFGKIVDAKLKDTSSAAAAAAAGGGGGTGTDSDKPAQQQKAHTVWIAGAKGTTSTHYPKVELINGVYEATDEVKDGMPVYAKVGSRDMWLTFSGNCWRIQSTEHRVSVACCSAYCNVPTKCLPHECPAGTWKVWDGKDNVLQPAVAVSSMSTTVPSKQTNHHVANHNNSSAFFLPEFHGFCRSTPVVTVPLSSTHLAFQTAVKSGDLDMVRAVHADAASGALGYSFGISLAIDVNFRDPNNGRTFLHWAACYGHTSVATFLIELGANVDLEGLGGATPLHLAAEEDQLEMIILLLTKGADKDKTNTAGVTALSLAARQGHLAVVQCLLDSGAEKDQINATTGDTALHLAAEHGHLDVVTCLIDHGVEKDRSNHLGKTPITRAFRHSHDSILEYFKSLELSIPLVSMRVQTPLVSSSNGPFGMSFSNTTKIYPQPNNGTELETGGFTNGDVVEVYGEIIANGFFKLTDGRGYVLASHLVNSTTPDGMKPAITMSSEQTQQQASKVRITGVTGSMADDINGEYEASGEMIGGMPCYIKVGDHKMCLEYDHPTSSAHDWHVKPIAYKGISTNCTYCRGPKKCLPQECPVGKWRVFDGKNHQGQPAMTISLV